MGFFNNMYVKNVVIDDNVCFANNSMAKLFENCRNYNGPVNVKNTVTNIFGIVNNCWNFNRPIEIPNSVVDMSQAFRSCNNFNQPIEIPNSVTAVDLLFYGCHNFNQPLNIPNSVINAGQILYDCRNFNSQVVFGNNVRNLSYSMYNCRNFGGNIHIKSIKVDRIDSFIAGRVSNKCKRINIYIPSNVCSTYTAIFGGTNHICGNVVTWTGSTYKYNKQYNVYVYWN